METPTPANTLYLIDGSGFIFRAYHSLPPLTRRDGTPVGAVYGFTNMMVKLMGDMKASHLCVVFDAGRTTFRNAIYDQYKAHRPPPPEDLIPQFPLIRDAVRAMRVPVLEMEGYEADDLIATLCCKARDAGMEAVIVSSDKDLMQLIRDGVRMFDPLKNRWIGPEEVVEKFGVPPERVVDVQALCGDSVDNVPGVPGIGVKTAAELIRTFGTVEDVIARAEEIKQPARRQALIAHAENALISKKLVQLDCIVPLDHNPMELTVGDDEQVDLLRFVEENGFKALSQRLRKQTGLTVVVPEGETPLAVTSAAPVVAQYITVNDLKTLGQWVARARYQGYVAFDTETDRLSAMESELVGVSLALAPGEACYIPLNHRCQGTGGAPSLLDAVEESRLPGQLCAEDALPLLKDLLEDPSVVVIGHNIKYDMLVMRRYGIEICSIDDSMLASYVLETGKVTHGMDDLAERHLGYKTQTFNEVTGTGKQRISFALVAIDKATFYAAEDADITLRLHQKLAPRIVEDKLATVYRAVEMPLVPVLVDMEHNGITVDAEYLRTLSHTFSLKLAELETLIFAETGEAFNVGSPKQLGDILFDKMGFKGGKKGKTGAYETGAEILEALAEEGHALPRLVLDWRQLSKLRNTYTDALQAQISPTTGRVHTSYSMAATSTGRLSSNEPNLQNIPIRTEEGRKIRKAFVASPGHVLLSADYSQIELRLLAHIAGIPSLVEAFRTGEDIHRRTAAEMFGVAPDAVDGELRRRAKTINFGIIYGISAFGLGSRLGIGSREAAAYIQAYFERYPGIKDYMEQTKAYCREHGFVNTLWGRRCYIRGINDRNPSMRSFSERAAINAPLQGTAADIIKLAMITTHKKLKQQLPAVKMLLQVHDELLFEVPEHLAEPATALIRGTMEGVAHLSVPLTVEIGAGRTWGDAH